MKSTLDIKRMGVGGGEERGERVKGKEGQGTGRNRTRKWENRRNGKQD